MDTRIARWIVTTSGIAAVGYLAFIVYANTGEVAETLGGLAWKWLAAALLLALLSYLIRALRWKYYLDRLGVEATMSQACTTYFAGLTMLCMPAVVSGVMKLGLVKTRVHAEVSRLLPIPLVERITDLIGMVLLGLSALLYFDLGYRALAGALVVVVVLIYLGNHRPLREMVLRRMEPIPWLGRHAHAFRKSLDAAETLLDRESVLISGGYAFGSWGLLGMSLYMLLMGFNEQLPLSMVLFVYAVPAILGVISQVPGGIGIEEGGTLALLLQNGIELPVATAIVLIFRLATLWFGLGLGILTLSLFVRQPNFCEAPPNAQ